MRMRTLTNRRAMALVAATLNDTEHWDGDMLDELALIVLASGRPVAGQQPVRRRLRLDERTALVAGGLVAAGIVGEVLDLLGVIG